MGHPFTIAFDPGPALMANKPHKADYTHLTTIKGVHPELWKWVRARALLENRTVGELVNYVIDMYREDVEQSNTRLEMISPYEYSTRYQVMARGVDPERWRWLKARRHPGNLYVERDDKRAFGPLQNRRPGTRTGGQDSVPGVCHLRQSVCDKIG